MKAWPNDLPPDLRKRLARALAMRSCGPADIWGEIKEWLEAHQIERPDSVPHHVPFGDEGRE